MANGAAALNPDTMKDLKSQIAALQGTPTPAPAVEKPKAKTAESDLMAQIEALKAENARLKTSTKSAAGITLKVSDKGALSLYGVGRFPVTLYQGQWAKVLDKAEEIKAFIAANQAALSSKDDK